MGHCPLVAKEELGQARRTGLGVVVRLGLSLGVRLLGICLVLELQMRD